MATRVASALEAAGLPVWLVVRDRALADLGLPLLCEAPSTESPHPLRGVLAALQSLEEGETALVVPCDLPGLKASGVARLLEAGSPSVAVDGAGCLHPLLAHLPGFWAPRVAAVLAVNGSATAALAGARPVPLPEDHLVNWNQPPG
jgi:molybdopterin-guanine dinucleotide biosynthesis protein A